MKLSIRTFSRLATVLFAACVATGCYKRVTPVTVVPQPAATATEASSQPSLVGTLPTSTSKDTPATTSATKSDISKAQQSNDMPMPGQANDHSTLASGAKQK